MPRPGPSPYPRSFDFLKHLPGKNIVQDDGRHVLVTTRGLAGVQQVDGALLCRRAFCEAAPFGYECLGHYKRSTTDGTWHATLNEAQGLTTRIFGTELDALVKLWSSRRHLDLDTLF
ncbi:MAG: hypothetical protein JSS56_19925 [Proteobacteria bacterium]|nr:hypothetical protein [Pseudomonadota bacterium]